MVKFNLIMNYKFSKKHPIIGAQVLVPLKIVWDNLLRITNYFYSRFLVGITIIEK
jgi:hypothetical protein